MEQKMRKSFISLYKKIYFINFNRLKVSAFGSFFFFLAANAFILFNYVPQHDSLVYVSDLAGAAEITQGRFMQSIYELFRGQYPIPIVIGLISIVCLTAMTYMLTDLLDIQNPFYIFVSAAFLSANITQTELLSSFIYIEDLCMTAAVLACMAVYILVKCSGTKWNLLSVLLLTLSLGLYQAYISFAATLILILIMKNLLEKGRIEKADRVKLFRSIAMFVFSGIFYFLLKKAVLSLTGLPEAGGYHSFRTILTDLKSIPYRLFVAYGSKFSMFFIRKGMGLGRIGNCMLTAAACVMVFRLSKKHNITLKMRCAFIILLIFSSLTALMMNIGAGMVAYRLSFAVFLYYLFFISILEMSSEQKTIRAVSIQGGACIFFILAVIWSNILYSNGAYTVQKVIFDRSISLYTRVLDDMYEIPEYVHDQTPVIAAGDWSFDNYAYDYALKEYRDLGTFLNTSATHRLTIKYLMRYLGEEINLIMDEDLIKNVTLKPDFLNMPSFPMQGYIQMIDGCLVIKFP